MTGGGYETGIPDMETAVKHVNEVAQAIDRRLRQLQDQVSEAMNTWKGSGSSSWDTLMARYDDDATKLNQALQSIAVLINDSSVILGKVETDNVDKMTRIASRLKSGTGGQS